MFFQVLDNLFALILEFKQHSLSLDLMDLIDEFDAEATFSAAVHSLSPKPGSILKRISPALQHSARMSSSLFDAASERDREQSFSQLQTSMQRFRQHADFLYRVLRQLGTTQYIFVLLHFFVSHHANIRQARVVFKPHCCASCRCASTSTGTTPLDTTALRIPRSEFNRSAFATISRPTSPTSSTNLKSPHRWHSESRSHCACKRCRS
jgi:hypothetical protein